MDIAFFGGTFDPPHLGHLRLARAALASGAVEAVRLVPAGTPPHKQGRKRSPFAARLAMCRLLVAGESALAVDDIEGAWGDGRPNYTIDTIRELRRRHPGANWRLLIGADMALIFDTWWQAEELLRLAPPLVAARPGFAFPPGFGVSLPKGLSPAGRLALAAGVFPFPPCDYSSTAIRRALATGAEPAGLPPAVAALAREKRLYAPRPANAGDRGGAEGRP